MDDLNNKNFVEEVKPTKQELKQEQNKSKALMAELLKPKKSKPQKVEKIIRDDDSLFDEEATPIAIRKRQNSYYSETPSI